MYFGVNRGQNSWIKRKQKTNNAGGGGGDPYWANVSLLMGFESADASSVVTDEGPLGLGTATAVGNAQADTAQKKYGTASALFDGTGDYFVYNDNEAWNFGNGQFTVECFVRYASVTTESTFVAQWGHLTTNAGWRLHRNNSVGLSFQFADTTQTYRATSYAWTPVVNTWYHIAVDRDASNVLRLYIDGSMVTSATRSETFQNSDRGLSIGSLYNNPYTNFLNGWIDELRITKGVARYASNGGFSVPTTEHPRG